MVCLAFHERFAVAFVHAVAHKTEMYIALLRKIQKLFVTSYKISLVKTPVLQPGPKWTSRQTLENYQPSSF